jgi:hypothetical protein
MRLQVPKGTRVSFQSWILVTMGYSVLACKSKALEREVVEHDGRLSERLFLGAQMPFPGLSGLDYHHDYLVATQIIV